VHNKAQLVVQFTRQLAANGASLPPWHHATSQNWKLVRHSRHVATWLFCCHYAPQ